MKYFLPGTTLVTRNIMRTWRILFLSFGFSGGSVIKNIPFNAGNMSSIPGSEKEVAAQSSILA